MQPLEKLLQIAENSSTQRMKSPWLMVRRYKKLHQNDITPYFGCTLGNPSASVS